ncbi:16S rRNA (uracil(1498)-N(3))-methyltransferase [Acidocella sp.]|uniref:16S rRNA (uracil(1498)-N(3))-methyltransferase n=1 Tax=Acidocella sp. TaxID=50710 RepID=UPI0026364E7A|nr:16S rRNA (uracil(1498)-N(3))-methyltransferase [Acidocella sp.]MDD2795833.1 16S rRNA (uracil(1498)-N(3))-methyltransferase [Acidocella sp.]
MSTTSIRLYTESPLHEAAQILLPEAQSHYLANVMRLAPGDTLRLFNAIAGEWRASVTKISRKAVALEVSAQTRAPAPEPDCWLCFALLKRQKTDLVVEKATELGASVIQPILTARTQADHVNLERLRAIATEAAEQCERLIVPEVRAPLHVEKLMANWPERRLFIADERRSAALLAPSPGPSALMIGPEGGFTDAELEGIARTPLVTRVSLGRRILRAETAAIAGLALLLAAEA